MVKRCLIFAFVFFLASCSSRKVETHKKQESVSELKQNDITTLENEKIKSDLFRVSESWNLNFSPRDPRDPINIIYGGDTLSVTNSDVSISKKETREEDHSIRETSRESSDQSKSEKEKDVSEKGKITDRQSSSWGLNIGLIFGIIVAIILIFLHFKTKPPKP
ncbi:hypothetical protein [Zunongwangia atlantica]|uniref:Lipoprotein n=1 Tax=Zunongwangia atlantica 22II14-10F7 TaxID=1185767 RepID=A0A1Y1SYD8_9FLAO|nr:hypothetical protein [Zunongwangia atlantica]ORL43767.1 hypothetical protein IIF7_18984 [Zunongwangia atlantica 22II14-10F7]